MNTSPKSSSLTMALCLGVTSLTAAGCGTHTDGGAPSDRSSSHLGGGEAADAGAAVIPDGLGTLPLCGGKTVSRATSDDRDGGAATDAAVGTDGGREPADGGLEPDPTITDDGGDPGELDGGEIGSDSTEPQGSGDGTDTAPASDMAMSSSDAPTPGMTTDDGAGGDAGVGTVRAPLSAVDSDEDGFSDAAEMSGTSLGVRLGSYGASPTHKDVFVYIAYYVKPQAAAIQKVMDAFAAAPLTNPDGTKGINLHVVLRRTPVPALLQNQNILGPCPEDNSGIAESWSAFDKIKAMTFPRKWRKVAHYVLFAKQISSNDRSGCSRGIPGHDVVVTLGNKGTVLEQAGTLMHELGHNLGLLHFGPLKRFDVATLTEDFPYQPNHLSIMTYAYQMYGLNRDGKDGVLDYSSVEVDGLDENALDEGAGMKPIGATTQTELARYKPKFGYTDNRAIPDSCKGPIDYNDSGCLDPAPVKVDLDMNGKFNAIPRSWNDWNDLQYQGLSTGGGVIGDVAPVGNVHVVVPFIAPEDVPPELNHQ